MNLISNGAHFPSFAQLNQHSLLCEGTKETAIKDCHLNSLLKPSPTWLSIYIPHLQQERAEE